MRRHPDQSLLPGFLGFVLIAILAIGAAGRVHGGDSAGADAGRVLSPVKTRPIAAWDSVPYQRLRQASRIGVVAFHESGVTVTFSVNGQELPPVVEPTLNAESRVWEYWIEIDPARIPAGPIEVMATARPKGEGHLERQLPALTLYADPQGDLAGATVHADGERGDDAVADGSAAKPFRTLARAAAAAGDGGTVLLHPGKGYTADSLGSKGSERRHWLVLMPAPGVRAEEVEIGDSRPFLDKVCFRGLTLRCDRTYWLSGSGAKHLVWLDGCRLVGNADGTGIAVNALSDLVYVTGGSTEHMQCGPGARFYRNHAIRHIREDAFRGSVVAINCTVEDTDRGESFAHPDFLQVTDPTTSGIIFYNVRGLRCRGQGLACRDVQESAFVNVLFEAPADMVGYTQWAGRIDHVLLWNAVIQNQGFLWREKTHRLAARAVYIENCIINRGMSGHGSEDAAGELTVRNCLFGKEWTDPGQQQPVRILVGTPLFEDPGKGLYRLTPMP